MRVLLIAFMFVMSCSISSQSISQNSVLKKDYEYFLDFFASSDQNIHNKALKYINRNWSENFEVYTIESMYFLKNLYTKVKLLDILKKNTKKNYRFDYNQWYEYIWSKKPTYAPSYHTFKSLLHNSIDNRFLTYFLNREHQSSIRLDEVLWGGVVQDGIPPLRNPAMISSKAATYLNNNDIVFGISINGDTRAYPKRILAWHEMFTDTVGGVQVAGVYCTLCGTVILYNTEKNGKQYQLGTSGFLYRSNKLMYDKKTQSLWNTLRGTPVIGPLVGKGIELDYLSVVTTTWGKWKKLHPKTTVLSLRTGHRRNYNEGVAYQNYFATDKLMFSVSKKDNRLKNKQEVLAIRLPVETEENIAISSQFLRKRHIYKHKINDKNFVVFTDKSGAHRVYFTKDVQFVSYNKKSVAYDDQGNAWQLHENKLENINTKKTLKRLHTYNAFWFGYFAAFPNVQLIK